MSKTRLSQTIYALASGSLPCAIAVVRVSGEQTRTIIKKICKKLPAPRKVSYCNFCNHKGEIIDDGILLWSPAPNSITAEDYAEFQLHGSKAVLAALFECFERIPDVRQAQQGEFTKKSFEAGKMNLPQIEALQDLIEAQTEVQRKQARYLMTGVMAEKIKKWRQKLLAIRALAEADIDFGDEDDIGEVNHDIVTIADQLMQELQDELQKYRFGKNIRDGVAIVLAGEPNSGKSSLMNAITGEDCAIVAEKAGTTRDVIEAYLNVGGYPARIYDTAGLRKTKNIVEIEGVKRAKKTIENADIILYLIDNQLYQSDQNSAIVQISDSIIKSSVDIIVLYTKSDLVAGQNDKIPPAKITVQNATGTKRSETHCYQMSVHHKHCLKQFIKILTGNVSQLCSTEQTIAVRLRHKKALEQCVRLLNQVKNQQEDLPAEIVAEKIRQCEFALDTLIGRIDVEQVLEQIFLRFCVGK